MNIDHDTIRILAQSLMEARARAKSIGDLADTIEPMLDAEADFKLLADVREYREHADALVTMAHAIYVELAPMAFKRP